MLANAKQTCIHHALMIARILQGDRRSRCMCRARRYG